LTTFGLALLEVEVELIVRSMIGAGLVAEQLARLVTSNTRAISNTTLEKTRVEKKVFMIDCWKRKSSRNIFR
jgi:hypothetical protein